MSSLRRLTRLLCAMAAGAVAAIGAEVPAPLAGALPEDLLPELKPILQRALNRSPETIRRGIEIEQAEAHALISRGAMLPNVGGYGRYSTNTAATASSTSSATNRSSGFYYDASLNQPIYHWGSLKAQADIDKLAVKIAEREYAEAYRLLARQLRAAYLDLITKKAALRAERRGLELAAKGLAQAEARFKEGRLTAGEIGGMRVGYDEAQLRCDSNAAAFAFAKRAFMRLSGAEELPDDAIPAEIPRPVPAADKGEGLLRGFVNSKAAADNRSQIFVLRVQQSDLNYTIAKAWLLPKFSFNAGHNVSNLTQADIGQVRQEAVVQNYYGVLVNWTIFDGLATRGRKLEALAQKRANERLLQTQIDASTDLAQTLRQQAEFSARALDFQENRLGGSRGGVTATKEDLARNRATLEDVEAAEAGVLRAEAETQRVRADYLNAWTEFVSLVAADPAMKNLPSRYVR